MRTNRKETAHLGKGAERRRQAPKGHPDLARSIALFERLVSLLSSDHDLQSAQASDGPDSWEDPSFQFLGLAWEAL